MDAARYFEKMHLAMSSQKPEYRLVLSVKVQDLGGADAYLELRQEPVSGRARVFYSTMGRQQLNFQLFRKGWQSCHNASGEMTGRFPATADGLLSQTDFSAFIRDDALDADRMARILQVLSCTVGSYGTAAPSAAREGALITVERFVGQPAHWSYWSTHAAEQLNIASILCWLGDYLAGAERRTLQSCPEAMQLAARWQAAFVSSLSRMECAAAPAPKTTNTVRRPASVVENKRWQSILAVLATV